MRIMGQRLVITCKYQDQKIAAIYYHWSAYTIAALCEAQELIDSVGRCYSIKEYQKSLISYICNRGGGPDGGIGSKECDYITNLYPNLSLYHPLTNKYISRNKGLIAISDEGIELLESAAEGTLIIDFDNLTINNECWYCTNLFEYVDETLDGDDSDLYLPTLDIDLNDINFNDLDAVINILKNVDAYMMPDEDCVIQLIG